MIRNTALIAALALGLSQVSLARLMGNTENTIANWERTGKLPAMGDKLIRVLYQGHRNGERSVKDVVESLNFSDRLKNQKLVLEASRRHRSLPLHGCRSPA